MRTRKRNYTSALWIGQQPDGSSQELIIEGVACYVVQTVQADVAPARRDVSRTSWDEFIYEWRFDRVVDRSLAGKERRLETLFPVLEAGGCYEIRIDEDDLLLEAPAVFANLKGRVDDQFKSYLSRLTSEVIKTPEGCRITKVKFDQWTGRVVSLTEIAPKAQQTLYDTKYNRIPAKIYGSDYHQEMIARATSGFRPQHVGGQRWLEFVDVLLEGYGQVHPSDDTVLSESFSHLRRAKRGLLHSAARTNWVSSEISLTAKRYISDCQPHILLRQPWDANYGHWLVDNFGRLAGAHGIDKQNVKFVLSKIKNEAITRVMTGALGLLGVREEQLVFVDMHPIRVRHALYPEPITSAPMVKHPAAIEFLESLVDFAANLGGRNFAPAGRVYISRNGGNRRRLLNEDAITPYFEKAGYVILQPEKMSFYDQVVTFGAASYVAGNMGAGFTNVAFSPKGVMVGCIANSVMPHDYFYDIACHKSGEYIGVQGAGATRIGDDFEVDVQLAVSAFRSHGLI